MAIIETISRLAANFLALLQTRLELLSVELEEESLRLFTYLICALAAMFCLGIAILLGILLIVVIYWDTHRVGVLVSLIAAFGLASVLLALWVRDSYRRKPRLLAHTLNELGSDVDSLTPG